ncbi:hypothetical protein [Conexibacter sp. DBS9H8]|nr:hypothetical protein [Conexibacter sp. DBS9H8]
MSPHPFTTPSVVYLGQAHTEPNPTPGSSPALPAPAGGGPAAPSR